jgi:hypothetical protein
MDCLTTDPETVTAEAAIELAKQAAGDARPEAPLKAKCLIPETNRPEYKAAKRGHFAILQEISVCMGMRGGPGSSATLGINDLTTRTLRIGPLIAKAYFLCTRTRAADFLRDLDSSWSGSRCFAGCPTANETANETIARRRAAPAD